MPHNMFFQNWLKDLDKIFIKEIGLTHDDVEDYMWHDEFDADISPQESFDEWNLLAGPDSGMM